ncbi:hypothetical protein GIB67_001648 [Kingdonia uniflora]|uniref:AB hydrolase-1 domain-containing protein n=1 Tax=Kingdonia uniflora TaxID=39325 RepID=A0A7J7L0X5_9MAGN|nr:hypothetical protein GIB67_001648 [Kingdonia uniflora]
MGTTRSALILLAKAINEILSFIVFSILDVLDVLLCFIYKLVDFCVESEWKACYCSSAKEAITSSGKIFVSEQGESKIVCVCSSKLQLEDVSDTLYKRSSLVSDISKSTVKELRRLKVKKTTSMSSTTTTTTIMRSCEKVKNGTTVRSTFNIDSTIVEMLQGKIERQGSPPIPRWSDCDCKICNSWSTSSCKETLFVHAEGPKGKVREDVLFIHGFISSSAFWTETLFPNFSAVTKSSYRLIAVDLLGFGRSPKPADSLYTLREHLEMVERSVIDPFKIKSFHIVAHSLGCILALAIAVKYPGSVKSITLISPPYYSVPKGEQATQYVMRRIAPRRIWPLIAFGASLACWVRTFLLDGFMCHTHNAAWHTLHNIICGTAGKLDEYLDAIRNQVNCDINVFHGRDDELLPVECSYKMQSRIPRARVNVIDKTDHITIVLGRQKAFARELEEIWKRSSSG